MGGYWVALMVAYALLMRACKPSASHIACLRCLTSSAVGRFECPNRGQSYFKTGHFYLLLTQLFADFAT